MDILITGFVVAVIIGLVIGSWLDTTEHEEVNSPIRYRDGDQ